MFYLLGNSFIDLVCEFIDLVKIKYNDDIYLKCFLFIYFVFVFWLGFYYLFFF